MIKAQKFHLGDEEWMIRVTFGFVDGAPVLSMRGATQQGRLALGLDENGRPGMTMGNENGKILWQAP